MSTVPTNRTPGLFAPTYYSAFHCIANHCRHSCCIDWEICIDGATYEKYKQIKSICDTVEVGEDGPCFTLTPCGRCPHLTDNGLCRIILTHGEDYLSQICQDHPRFYNDVGSGRREVGLGIVCEEACRLILSGDAPFALVKIEELPADGTVSMDEPDFDPLPDRDHIITIIESPKGSYTEKIVALQSEYALPLTALTDEWPERLLELEILDEAWERDLSALQGKLRPADSTVPLYDQYYTRLLTYFVYRHVSTAEHFDDLRARLAFALLSAEVIRSLFAATATTPACVSAGAPEALIDFARRYSAEIEYSEENTAELIFAIECEMMGEAETASQ